jgi:hypothetical protein
MHIDLDMTSDPSILQFFHVLGLVTAGPETRSQAIEMSPAPLNYVKNWCAIAINHDTGTDFCPSRHSLYTNFSIVISATSDSEVAPHRK